MLRPSRPMIRPFISSDGRWTTETVCSAVWSAATRWMAVTTMSRALSWASSRALRSIARAILTASCSASSRTASMRMPLASSADMLATRSSAATCSPCARASSSRVLSSSRSRSRSLRSRCSSMSVRWSSCSSRCEEAALEAGQLGAPGAGLFLGLALHAQLLVLGLEDQFLLAGARLGLDPARFGRRGLHRLGCPEAAQQHADDGSADGGHDGHRQDEQGIHYSVPPIRPIAGRTCVKAVGAPARSIGDGRRPGHCWDACRAAAARG